jgi:steroid delta-isomerase-like uncharacterized protein
MSISENTSTVRRCLAEQFGPGDLSSLEQCYTADLVVHDPANPNLIDLASNMRFIAELRTAYPDAAVTIDDQIAEGDRVATRWTFRGTNSGELPGNGPAGMAIEVTGITISRLREGRIAEEWVEWDALGLTRKLGLPLE